MTATLLRPAAAPAVPAAASWPARGGGLRIWTARVGDISTARLDPGRLDASELRRLATFERRADALRYLAAHCVLRDALGSALGRPPVEVAFVREPCPECGSPRGRPAIRDADGVHFSLSTSGEVILVALAGSPVGVDVEQVAPLPDGEDWGAMLHPRERAELRARPAARRPEAFARVWTRKEAYLKGVGTGLGHGMTHPCLGLRRRPPRGWSLASLPVGDGYEAAVAVLDRR